MGADRLIKTSEIRRHNIPTDLWIVVHGVVWDITDYVDRHPGGASVIHRFAGSDATAAYSEVHPNNLISDTLGQSKRVGLLDSKSVDQEWEASKQSKGPKESEKLEKPPLEALINSFDFDEVASRTLSKKAWAYYSSAATDLVTLLANRKFFNKIWFRPRGLVDVKQVSTRTQMFGHDISMPLYVAPAALAKLAHPDGEKALARACARMGIPLCFSTNASYTMEEIVEAAPKDATLFFQLYVNSNRAASEKQLADAERLGIKAIFITIDAPVPGKREADERVRAEEEFKSPITNSPAKNDKRGGGIARTTGAYIDSSLNWKDLNWIKTCTKLPLVIKGIQSAADAKLALDHGCQGIVVSNHGGRCLDSSPPSILTLLEIHRQFPEVFEGMEVYLDSGVRRGTDILKAICLGARAVGVGRPFLYSLVYGEDGAAHLIDILKDELEMSMKTLGVRSMGEAAPEFVNTLAIDQLVPSTGKHPYARWRPKARI